MTRKSKPIAFVFLAVLFYFLVGCSDTESIREKKKESSGALEFLPLTRIEIGEPLEDEPWITHVRIADLNGDSLLDILVCDGLRHRITWLENLGDERFAERLLADEIQAPVHAEAIDFDQDGDNDVLVASMGVVFPNNEKIGSVIVFENDGSEQFGKRVLLENTSRVSDVQAADLDGDGDLDLAVAQFGYNQGEVRWMRQVGEWKFESEILLDRSGAINVAVTDMNGDGSQDIVALISQEWEEIYLFINDGQARFSKKRIYGSTNADYGSSGISLADLNGDGRPDILYTNGDGFDIARPGPRPWHAVQWLENLGENRFAYRRLGEFPGAYAPIAADMDEDGDLDVLAVSTFADWNKQDAISLIMFRQEDDLNFEKVPLAQNPTHLLTVDAADFDGDGKVELVTGGFHAYPPYDKMSRLSLWRQ